MSQNYCTQCGSRLPEGGNFCPQCGAPAERDTPAPATSPPPAPASSQLDAELSAQTETVEQPEASSRGLVYALGGLALVAVLLGVVYFAFLRPGGSEGAASAELSDCGDEPCTIEAVTAGQPDIPYPEVARISVDDAHMRLADGSAIFLDVRDRDSYTSMHIPGALWIPLDEVAARQGELPKDAEILTYCT